MSTSSDKFYQRKSRNMKFSSMEIQPQPPGMQEHWIPETPAKLTQVRPQKIHASIYEEEKDQGCLFVCSDNLIDLNKSICDLEDRGITACQSEDSEDSANDLPEAALVAGKEREESSGCVVNISGYSEGDFTCQETINSLSDTKSCANDVARSLDFWTSGLLNEGLDELNPSLGSTPCTGSLNCCSSVAPPAVQESEIARTPSEASQESPEKDAIGWSNSPSFQVSGSRIDRKIKELEKENPFPENHNPLLDPDLENGTSNPESHVHQCAQENDKLQSVCCLETATPACCLEPATPAVKHNVNKRQRKDTDVNQKPLQRIKKRKHRHRPKIAGQGRSKRPLNNSLQKNKEKKNYVRETPSSLHKEKGKPSIQQTSTAEHHLLSVVKHSNDEKVIENLPPEVGGVPEVDVKGGQVSDDKMMPSTVSTVSELAVSHPSDDKPTALWDVKLEMKSATQSNMSSFGGQKFLSDLDLDVSSVRWNVHGTRSTRDCCRNPFLRKKTGFQHRSSWVNQMSLKINHCLSTSRRVEPSFPKICKRRRIKRQRKSILSIMLGSLRSYGCIKKKRSKRIRRGNLLKPFIPIGNLSPLAMVQMLNDQMLNILLNQTSEFKKSVSDSIEQLSIGEEKGELNNERNVLESPTEIEHFLHQSLGETKVTENDSVSEKVGEEICGMNSLWTGMGLSHRQALTNEENEIQVIHPVLVIPSPHCSKFQDGSLLEHKELQLVAKSKGVSGTQKVNNRKVSFAVTVEHIIDKFKKLKISETGAIVPLGSYSTKKPKPKVLLDSETMRRWNKLMQINDGAGKEQADEENEKKWEEERKIFRGRVDAFTSIMHSVLGDRRFKPWKGSVVDSVVGVFLTQNVSDFLSSSAYMSLAAKFPVQPTNDQEASANELENKNRQGSISSNISYSEATQDAHGNQYFITEPEPETPVDVAGEISLVDIEDLGNTFLSREYSLASHKSHDSELREDNETVVEDNMSEVRFGMKGDQHTKSEMNEAKLKVLYLVTRIRCTLKEAADKTRKTTGGKKEKAKERKVEKSDWDDLRRMYCRPRTKEQTDTVDWEAVRQAPSSEIAEIIKGRGQHTVIAQRIQDFLNRVVDYHGSIDLEWLRYAPPDLVKTYLLEIPGLGLKSVECIRLLSLEHKAFPVDVNVARILVRLGWIPLEPLPGDLQFHLLEEYPIMDSIQKYLWPRLAELDQRTLYELHYHMITVGKVVCTKKNPNCGACPMKAECRHFASAVASANISLPAPSKKGEERSIISATPVGNIVSVGNNDVIVNPTSTSISEYRKTLEFVIRTQNCEPIIEEPASPQLELDIDYSVTGEDIIEDDEEEEEEIPTIKLNNEAFKENVHYFMDKYGPNLQTGNLSRDVVPVSVNVDSVPVRKLKHTNRLRTEHQVYEIPDGHELLRGFEKRDCDDPLPYLLAIWTAGETPDSCEPPKKRCNSEGQELCNDQTCFSCQTIIEERADIVRGTIMVPCRTAMRGRFPLNGTYFQVNEVFAEHQSSYNPIVVSRSSIWHLKMRTVYIGTSPSAIFKGTNSIRDIQENFWKGFICVRGWDSKTGEPKPLCKRFHCPPGKMEKVGKRRNQHAANDTN